MTMKRILHWTLMFVVLVTNGCDLISSSDTSSPSPKSNSQPSPQPRNSINFTGAADDLGEALKRLNPTGRSAASATVKPVKVEIDKAIKKLGNDREEIAQRCSDCVEDTINGAAEVLDNLKGMLTRLGPDSETIAELSADAKRDVQVGLTGEAEKLKQLSTAEPKTNEGSPVGQDNADKPNTEVSPWWWSPLILVFKIVGGLLALILIASLLSYLWKRAWKTVELNMAQVVAGHLAANREAQPDYGSKLSSLSSAQSELSGRLNELNTEVRSLARLVRDSLGARRPDGNPSYGGLSYQSHAENISPKEEPEFPVSAVDYLGKMDRFATVVRPDFQNGILVNDPDGTGELVLIRDSRYPDETQPLFVVPSATQFHTKQDFYTYYQKYYDCPRPSAGDVWIIDPAVVERVAGGWQLREKGMLEIR